MAWIAWDITAFRTIMSQRQTMYRPPRGPGVATVADSSELEGPGRDSHCSSECGSGANVFALSRRQGRFSSQPRHSRKNSRRRMKVKVLQCPLFQVCVLTVLLCAPVININQVTSFHQLCGNKWHASKPLNVAWSWAPFWKHFGGWREDCKFSYFSFPNPDELAMQCSPPSRLYVWLNLSHFLLLEPSVSDFFQCCFTLEWQKTKQRTHQAGNVNCCSRYGKQFGGTLKNKNRATIWSSNPTPGHISRKDESSNLKGEWIKKMWYIHTMEY